MLYDLTIKIGGVNTPKQTEHSNSFSKSLKSLALKYKLFKIIEKIYKNIYFRLFDAIAPTQTTKLLPNGKTKKKYH